MRQARRYIGHRVAVETSKGSLVGRLLRVSRDSVTLDDVELRAEGKPIPMAGEVVIPLPVAWLQAVV